MYNAFLFYNNIFLETLKWQMYNVWTTKLEPLSQKDLSLLFLLCLINWTVYYLTNGVNERAHRLPTLDLDFLWKWSLVIYRYRLDCVTLRQLIKQLSIFYFCFQSKFHTRLTTLYISDTLSPTHIQNFMDVSWIL